MAVTDISRPVEDTSSKAKSTAMLAESRRVLHRASLSEAEAAFKGLPDSRT